MQRLGQWLEFLLIERLWRNVGDEEGILHSDGQGQLHDVLRLQMVNAESLPGAPFIVSQRIMPR